MVSNYVEFILFFVFFVSFHDFDLDTETKRDKALRLIFGEFNEKKI